MRGFGSGEGHQGIPNYGPPTATGLPKPSGGKICKSIQASVRNTNRFCVRTRASQSAMHVVGGSRNLLWKMLHREARA